MNEYYLRVSVKESETKTHQYNWFSTYGKYDKSQQVLQWMLADIIETYKLEAGSVLVEQFSKF